MAVHAGAAVRFRTGFPYAKLHESFCCAHEHLALEESSMHELRSLYDAMSENALAGAQRIMINELPHLEAWLKVFELPQSTSAWIIDSERIQEALTAYEIGLANSLDYASRYVTDVFKNRTRGWDLHGELQSRHQRSIEHVQRMLATKCHSLRGQAQYVVRSRVPEVCNPEIHNRNLKRSRHHDIQDPHVITSKKAKHVLDFPAVEQEKVLQQREEIVTPTLEKDEARANSNTATASTVCSSTKRKRKSRDDFITGSITPATVPSESALEKTKREAAAVLEARMSEFDASTRFTQSMDISLGSAADDDDDKNNSDDCQMKRINKKNKPHGVCSAKTVAASALSSTPSRTSRASKPPTAGRSTKKSAVKSASESVKKKQPVSLATLNDARITATAELLRRTEQYTPTSRGSANKEAPAKKRVRK